MLGSTASGVYWMFRYLERSENIARLVDAGFRIAMTRSSAAEDEWRSVLETSASRERFEASYPEVSGAKVINFLLRDSDNPSSVWSCMCAARQNARRVRSAITRDVWEAVNDGWLTLKSTLARQVSETDLPDVLAQIRQQSTMVRGALQGTMLRTDIFDFCRLGTFIERTDATARILDVKYYVLLPSANMIGSSLDNVQWQTILRGVSSEHTFGWLHGDAAGPHTVAEFLIVDQRMPRSLAFCTREMLTSLDHLTDLYGEKKSSHTLATQLHRRIADRRVGEILDEGLHDFLTGIIAQNSALSAQIEQDYRFRE